MSMDLLGHHSVSTDLFGHHIPLLLCSGWRSSWLPAVGFMTVAGSPLVSPAGIEMLLQLYRLSRLLGKGSSQ